ncbi:secondary thiamine-phosphate synthase enzyme YjbQ [Nisaea acidiphila]|uniref:Secondary thiamine-phosphate synthase enzyme YjbQ n=1 Tax=Nisaea acidiphila TaxID=1862145 RepID=A0A9J7APP4_9PROT|nr:secondary thiamine-phosphate synthase enzyme YjbQ [Nisaea acidiphila]UUX49587.1 secondary thiamine-phosphate synthase enzyme YjbQ [Nisaea acidiphila]
MNSVVSRQAQEILPVGSRGTGFYDVTREVAHWVGGTGIGTGLLTLFIRHTSASLTIQENADPDVRADLADYLATIAPEDPGRYRHGIEGPDDMPAHIRTMLTQTSLTIPVGNGRPLLGTWQGIYLIEHRRAPHRREIVMHLLGE